jgi:hypothetical protein
MAIPTYILDCKAIVKFGHQLLELRNLVLQSTYSDLSFLHRLGLIRRALTLKMLLFLNFLT